MNMHLRGSLAWILVFIGVVKLSVAQEKITFPSQDGVMITADLYAPHPDTVPMILLFHQAGWSRGEFTEVAPKLNRAGYNCLAVDLRSGRETNGVINETYLAASQAMKPTQYVHSLPDVEAALRYARQNLARGPIVLLGSSYSASLVLVAGSHPSNGVSAIVSFSPGEYFSIQGKSKQWVAQEVVNLEVPVLITSARSELSGWEAIFTAIPEGNKHSYIPESSGNHGSRALWERYPDHRGYWQALLNFLSENIVFSGMP